MREADVVRRCKQIIESFEDCYCIKVNTGAFGTAGTPDIIACIAPHGRMLVVECKVWPSKPTKTQRYQLDRWERAGALGLVIYDHELERLRELIDIEVLRGGIEHERRWPRV